MYASKRSVVLGLAPLLCALSAFSQARVASLDPANQLGEEAVLRVREKQVFAVPTFNIVGHFADHAATAVLENNSAEDSGNLPPIEKLQSTKPPDLNRDMYYRNKLEFSFDAGWLPINIPFPLDVFVGDVYNTYPFKYTLVPIIASLRWHINGLGGPSILRGNWDLAFSGSITAIPRGPESRYLSYNMGIRRNFVPRSGKIAPYFDVRLGVGNIDAKGPKGVQYAQGEDLTFTVNMGSGMRYNLSPRYAISAGLNFMHISNLDLSQGNGKPDWGIRNYGINVYGPMVGIDVQLRRHQRHIAH